MTDHPHSADQGIAPAAPRLRIAHLFLWMACTAAMLGAAGPLGWRPAAPRFDLPTVNWILQYAGLGAGLAAVLLWPIWELYGMRFPAAPGDWLLLATTCGALLVVVLNVLTVQLDHRWSIDIERLAWALAFALPAVIVKKPRLWKTLFVLLVGEYASRALLSGLDRSATPIVFWSILAITTFATLAETVLLPLLLLNDLVRHRHYPWTHWTGIVVFYAVVGLNVLDVFSFFV